MLINLGVGGPQSLDELQTMAERTFGEIRRQSWDGNGQLDNGALVSVFPYGYLRRKIQIQTVSDTKKLLLLFPMPDLVKKYQSDSESYVRKMLTNRRRDS